MGEIRATSRPSLLPFPPFFFFPLPFQVPLLLLSLSFFVVGQLTRGFRVKEIGRQGGLFGEPFPFSLPFLSPFFSRNPSPLFFAADNGARNNKEESCPKVRWSRNLLFFSSFPPFSCLSSQKMIFPLPFSVSFASFKKKDKIEVGKVIWINDWRFPSPFLPLSSSGHSFSSPQPWVAFPLSPPFWTLFLFLFSPICG